MQNPSLSIGEQIQARCTKCRKNLEHILVSLAEGEPDQVQCTVCSRQHSFRPPTKPKKAGAKRALSIREVERQEWQALRPGMDNAKANEYSMTGIYKEKSLIEHPVFGLGLVQRVVGTQKIEVLFEEGRKTLRCR